MTSSKFTKTNIWLPTLIVAILLILVGFPLRNKLNDNIRPLEARISDLDTQIKTLPKKERFLLEKLEKEKISLENDIITFKNNNYGLMIQSLGGIFFVVTAFFTWRNVITAEANLQATEEKLVTERYSKAIELLASEKLEMRLGGIYALGRIAKDSEKDYWQVMEVLTTLIREKNIKDIVAKSGPFIISKKVLIYIPQNPLDEREQAPDEEPYDEERYYLPEDPGEIEEDDGSVSYLSYDINKDYIYPIQIDIQAILTVLGDRKKPCQSNDKQILDLTRTDLRGAILSGDLRDVDFENANLGYTILKNINLSKVNLSNASMARIKVQGEVILEKANLSNARLQFADLTGANLKGTVFKGAMFHRAVFKNAIIDEHTNFSGALDLSVKEIKLAKNWQKGIYSPELKKDLGIDNTSIINKV